jgi:Uma2 family endonuclease
MVARKVLVAYEVPEPDTRWELTEEDVPESAWHDAIIELLKLILKAWAARAELPALVSSNLALRWMPERWKVGVDPDVSVYVPPPPDGEDTTSVCTWEPGHHAPRIAVEVVSRSTATKDYVTGPDQYAASGTAELWVFDPKRYGPKVHGGPFVLQLWRRDEAGVFRQVYRGAGPCFSPELKAWLVVTDEGSRLRVADDADGVHRWPTQEERAEIGRERAEAAREQAEAAKAQAEAAKAQAEAAKAQAEAAKAQAEAAKAQAEAAKAQAEARVAALEAELARLRG